MEKKYCIEFVKKDIGLQNLEKSRILLDKNGFVILKKSIPKKLILKIKHDVETIIKKGKISNKFRDIHFFKNGEISSAHNLLNYVKSYKKLLKTKIVTKIIKNYLKEMSNEEFNSSYFAKPKFQGLETKPHQDNAFFCMQPADVLTCWMPITFANKKNGSLYYYAGSHNLGNLKHKPRGNLGASMCLDFGVLKKINKKFKKIYIDLELGDCVLHNSLVVHGSEPNLSNLERNAFNFSIGSKFAVKNMSLFKSYKKNLDIVLSQKKS